MCINIHIYYMCHCMESFTSCIKGKCTIINPQNSAPLGKQWSLYLLHESTKHKLHQSISA